MESDEPTSRAGSNALENVAGLLLGADGEEGIGLHPHNPDPGRQLLGRRRSLLGAPHSSALQNALAEVIQRLAAIQRCSSALDLRSLQSVDVAGFGDGPRVGEATTQLAQHSAQHGEAQATDRMGCEQDSSSSGWHEFLYHYR